MKWELMHSINKIKDVSTYIMSRKSIHNFINHIDAGQKQTICPAREEKKSADFRMKNSLKLMLEKENIRKNR